jgi:16S rRNA (uracil1498-N3)-methyltransferase
MAHVPHLYLPGPWTAPAVELDDRQKGHLTRVLRRPSGVVVSYTDGAGITGEGTFTGSAVVRGDERLVGRQSPELCLAVAPPRSNDRVRFLVEKLGELGVDELRWITTRFGQGTPPAEQKARVWAIGALEQSRGARLMSISGPVGLDELDEPLLVGDLDGRDAVPSGLPRYTLVIGPEGGLHDEEVPHYAARIALSERVLRTETAAIVGAAALLGDNVL